MFVLVLYSPIHLFKLMRATKYRRSTLPRLGFAKMPQRGDFQGKIYLFHSVSVGETQAAEVLVRELKQRQPDCRVYLSTVTETGQDVAAKMPLLDGHFFLPFDLSFLMRRLFRGLRPDAVMVVETDLWLTYLRQAQKASIPVYLINAKLSEKSMRGYQRMPWLPCLTLLMLTLFILL